MEGRIEDIINFMRDKAGLKNADDAGEGDDTLFIGEESVEGEFSAATAAV